MATNPYVNKVQYGSTVLVDLTADTVTVNVMLSGYTAHDASGAPITGTVADGNDLAYGTSSCLVGTAKVGTGYVWTDGAGEVCVAGHSTADNAYAY